MSQQHTPLAEPPSTNTAAVQAPGPPIDDRCSTGGTLRVSQRLSSEGRSVDEVMMRSNLTVGAGLNELENIQQELVDINRSEDEPSSPPGTPPPFPSSSAVPSCADHKVKEKQSLPATDFTGAALVLLLGLIVRSVLIPPSAEIALSIPTWLLLVTGLATTALILLGIDNVKEVLKELYERPSSGLRIPLTDTSLDLSTMNKFANSAQVREKGLKILQYVLRGASYTGYLPKETSSTLKSLSKTTSIARRFFKFCRWIKHFEDLSEAREQKSAVLTLALYLRIVANFGADWAEDICSLERMGFLKSGTLSTEFLLFAEYCQLVLALVEIAFTAVRARKESQVYHLAKNASASKSGLVAQRRKLALVRLELIKFVSDIGKALFDCELYFAHEGVFIGCAFFSALLSTHKNMLKVIKSSK